MNTSVQSEPSRATKPARGFARKLLIPFVVGGAFGAAAAKGLFAFVDFPEFADLDPAVVAAMIVSVVYVAIGLVCLVGAGFPRFGARFLNVEDADELREERGPVLTSGIACFALAAPLVALALATPVGPVPVSVALAVFFGGWAPGFALSVKSYRQADELMRAVCREGSELSYYLVFLIIGGWAALAHLAVLPSPSMLGIVTAFYILPFAATVTVTARRGMLAQR